VKSCSSGAGRGVYTNVRWPQPSRSPFGCAARRRVICENEGVPKTAGQRFSTGQPKIDTFSLRCSWLRTRVMLALGVLYERHLYLAMRLLERGGATRRRL